MKKLSIWALLVCAAFAARPASAVPVTIELLLLVDVSGSIDASEYTLQKQGYVNAFLDPAIQAAIIAQPQGVAVAYAEWAGIGTYNIRPGVGWTLLTNAASINAFAAALLAAPRTPPSNQNTAPGAALLNGIAAITTNDFEGKKIIDVSGDGRSNNDFGNDINDPNVLLQSAALTLAQKVAAAAAGITVNGLPILGAPGEDDLESFYQNKIVTADGFLVVADGFLAFDTAIKQKIQAELLTPEPTTISMMGLGLLGLGYVTRRRIKK